MESKTYQKWLETDKKVTELILNEYRHINTTDTDWYDYILDEFSAQCSKIGFVVEPDDISFSGFWCQGDGASFTGEINIFEYLKASKELTRYRSVVNAINAGKISDTFFIVRNTRNYSHENTCSVEDIDEYDDISNNISTKTRGLVESLQAELETKRRDLCLDLYNDLNTEYKALTSDECVIDTLEANEYIFNEFGQIDG